MAPIRVDPEFAAISAAMGDQLPPPPSAAPDIATIRHNFTISMQAMSAGIPIPDGLQESTHTTTTLDGTASLSITRFLPKALQQDHQTTDGPATPGRAVIFVFGGGTVAGSVAAFSKDIANRAERSNTQYFAVEYRLAPEHPYPAAMEDVYASILWLQQHAAEFHVDPARIILQGVSAGGLIAVAAAMYARDTGLKGGPGLAGLFLQYPMLDDRTELQQGDELEAYLLWNSRNNRQAWEAYLGKPLAERNDDNVPVYASPGRAKDVSNLPRTFMYVGGLDLFRDEDIAFAAKLAKLNADVEFHLVPGQIHGFDNMSMLSVNPPLEQFAKRFVESI